MSDNPMGRPPEPPSTDYYNTQEAATILGVSDETVRNWIRSKRLDGDRYVTRAKEIRYHASKASVEAEARRLGRHPTNSDLEAESKQAVEQVIYESQCMTEALTKEIRINREVVVDTCNQLFEYLEAYKAEVLEMAEQEQKHQAESLKIQRETLDLLRRVENGEQQRAEDGKKERRSFWRRLLT